MRLIDVATCIGRLATIANLAKSDPQKSLLGRAMYIVENTPTVEAVPVKPLAEWLSHASMAPNARGDILSLSSDTDAFFEKNTQYWEEFLREMDWSELNDEINRRRRAQGRA